MSARSLSTASLLLITAMLGAPAAGTPLHASVDPPARTLSGRVVNAEGTPLAQVRITVLETNRSAQTDAEGHYVIPELPGGTYGVSFSLVGYAPEMRRVTIADEDVVLDVAMRRSRIELPPLQVTASPLATTALTSPQPTSVVSGADLDQSQAASLGETISDLAGVRNYSTGSGIGKPVIRGLTSNRILVLADGQRLENQQWGDEHGPNVETATAERIEVIRGPASVLYGSDALGGVINVVERELPDATGTSPIIRGRVTGEYGTNGDAPEGTLALEGARRGLGFRGSLTGRRSGDIVTPGGELFNSGNRSVNGQGAVGLRGGWGEVTGSYDYSNEHLEIHEDPAEDPGATPFQRIANHRAQLKANLPVGVARLEMDMGFERNQRREFEEREATDVALGLTSETWTGNAHFHHAPLGPLGGIVGVSLLRTGVDKFGEESLIPDNRSTDYGVYLFEQTERGPWHLSFGARYDYRTLDVDADADLGVAAQGRSWSSITGNVGALYKLSEPMALVLNVGRGFRAPSAFDLFANGVHEGTVRFERGDPTLRVEKSLNSDLALRVQTAVVSAELGGFVNFIDDYIYPDPTGEIDPESGFQIYQTTQGNARLMGIEAAGEVHPTSFLHLRTSADYTHGQNTTTDQPLPFVPPFRVTYSARLEPGDRGWLRGPYLQFGGETNARQTRLDPDDFGPDGYTIFNASAGASLPLAGSELSVDLLVRNLFDTDYRSFLSRYKLYAEDPGRNVILRMSMGF